MIVHDSLRGAQAVLVDRSALDIAIVGVCGAFLIFMVCLAVDNSFEGLKNSSVSTELSEVLLNVHIWRRSWTVGALISLGAAGLFAVITQLVGGSPIIWLFRFLLSGTLHENLLWFPMHMVESKVRFFVLARWLLVFAAFVAVTPLAVLRFQLYRRARKLFHILAVLLFSPPLFRPSNDPMPPALAHGVAAALLLVAEVLRVAGGEHGRGLWPFGTPLRRYYAQFVDLREGGDGGNSKGPVLVLTPLYLLLGCAVPHWIATALDVTAAQGGLSKCPGGSRQFSGNAQHYQGFTSAGFGAVALAGVISLGVGDAVAAVVGSALKTKTLWPSQAPGNYGSVEGSAAAAASMFLAAAFLFPPLTESADSQPRSAGPDFAWLGVVAGPFFLVVVLEAYASAVDNLTLPIYTTSLLMKTLL